MLDLFLSTPIPDDLVCCEGDTCKLSWRKSEYLEKRYTLNMPLRQAKRMLKAQTICTMMAGGQDIKFGPACVEDEQGLFLRI